MQASSPTTSTNRAGFTLVELLVTLVIAGGFVAAFTSFYLSQQRAFREQQMTQETVQQVRGALDQMVRDLRSAGRNPQSINRWAGIIYAAPHMVFFTLDLNDNGSILDPGELKHFMRVDRRLDALVPGPITSLSYETMAEWLTRATAANPTFRYYTWDQQEITTMPPLSESTGGSVLDTIRYIDITLTAERTLPGGRTFTHTEVARVSLRNL